MESESINSGSGVVTFLDVLGWKGIFDRTPDAIKRLTNLIRGLRARADQQRGKIGSDTLIKSISDTIAIFTSCNDGQSVEAIQIHGVLCQWAISQSIDAEIPLRGAIAYGEFALSENIFVGRAVDEAAAWHEYADWFGVHLTPSAEYVFKQPNQTGLWHPYTPPNKVRINWKPCCVNWTQFWKDRTLEEKNLKSKFRRLGPIVPDIAIKFANTLSFVTEMNAVAVGQS